MNLVIRKMTVEDISAVVALDQMSFSLPWPERSFRFELTNNPASRCWVAEVDGRIVGIATHPEYRRQGIAKKLLSHSLRYMNGEGAVSSFLEVRESNTTAREMYRKFGYEVTGRRRAYYKDNNEDAILMTLEKINIELLSNV
jgi:[ribosomal protein S18]-alanine N-acetyltransferase